MRAGPFSDESVCNLLNRRFIPFHFDLQDSSYLGDPQASKYLKEKLPEFIGKGSVSTPPIVFLTPAGKIVGQASNYAPTEEFMEAALKALNDNPEYNGFSESEKKLKGVEKAKLLVDLRQLEEAASTLKEVQTDEAKYWKGRIVRLQGNRKSAETYFQAVKTDSLRSEVRMERALIHWAAKEYDQLISLVSDFPSESERYNESRYYHGLALFHKGDVEDAKKVWKDLIESTEEDRWVYRADWAYYEADSKKTKSGGSGGILFSSSANPTTSSPLGRIGYMGQKHPDLKTRK